MSPKRRAQKMSREVRQVFCLCKVYGHSRAQIAEELHLSPERVERDLEIAALALIGRHV